MKAGIKIGIIREGKSPADSRVVLTPEQISEVQSLYRDVKIVVQPSNIRCYTDEEYRSAGVPLQEDLNDCDVLIGVKEVPVVELIDGKTYFFFSHTIKKQAYNRKLLQTVLQKNIRLIDYECLTDNNGIRVIAFGRWAGIVGAYNGLYTWGQRSGEYTLKRAVDCHDFADLKGQLKDIKFPPVKIVTTGSGRVAGGANELLTAAGIREVSAEEFLLHDHEEAVFANLKCEHLYARESDSGFELREFFQDPELYRTIFSAYSQKTDLFINSIYWDPAAPAYFSLEDMSRSGFSIRAIADITCDIAPEASIPSTIRPSTIDDPVYGFDPVTHIETQPYQQTSIDVMAVDNLPNELPRDASESFGNQFLTAVLDELVIEESAFIDRATIARDGRLTHHFEYLREYVEGKA